MARKRTNFTLEEQLENTNNKIKELETNLQDLHSLKKQLEDEINKNRLIQLDEMIKKSGKSFDEIFALISQ